MDDVESVGLNKPVLPGILPVTSLSSIPRMAQMGCAVPSWLIERLEAAGRRGGPGDVAKAGIDAATELCAAFSTRAPPGSTSIPSTARRRHAKSTPTWAYSVPPVSAADVRLLALAPSTVLHDPFVGDPMAIGVVVDEQVTAAQPFGRHARRPAPAEEVRHQVTRVARGPD